MPRYADALIKCHTVDAYTILPIQNEKPLRGRGNEVFGVAQTLSARHGYETQVTVYLTVVIRAGVSGADADSLDFGVLIETSADDNKRIVCGILRLRDSPRREEQCDEKK